MSTAAVVALVATVLAVGGSAAIGVLGLRFKRSTSDFVVASRGVGPAANARAISGEYLSAASFLGIAGLILRDGVDALWYPVGYTAGYLALVLFVAAPLRRSGAYTVPDFAEARLQSTPLRHLCTLFVVIIGWLYLLPQIEGAGLTLAMVTNLPGWIGSIALVVVVVATVLFGGIRSMTFVQAFQYWLKFSVLVIPAVLAAVILVVGDYHFDKPAPPEFRQHTSIAVNTDVVLQVGASTPLAAVGVVDGMRIDGTLTWAPGDHTVEAGARLEFDAGLPVPVVAGAPATDAAWLNPLSGTDSGLLATYSLIIATFLGTMGLPHVLVSFYTNADGRAARRTAVIVIGLLGGFYVIVTLLGVLSRIYTPHLLVSGETDAAVLLLPTALFGSSLGGILLGAVVVAGSWAAFLSASSGLVVSVAGVVSTAIGGNKVRDFRYGAIIAGAVPLALALFVERLDFAVAVALVFAVAASTFCPLLMLGIWWRGLTDTGAIAGVVVGGGLAVGAVVMGILRLDVPGWLDPLLYRPAIISVPAAFFVMVVGSLLTAHRCPVDADQVLLHMHAPERLGLGRGTVRRT